MCCGKFDTTVPVCLVHLWDGYVILSDPAAQKSSHKKNIPSLCLVWMHEDLDIIESRCISPAALLDG